MVRVRFGQGRQSAAVEVDPIVLDEVWVFAWIHAARLKPDLSLHFVHFIDGADDPVALSDLVLQFPRHTVVQIEMVPAVAL